MVDRSRLLAPQAVECVERLAELPELADAVGEISAQHLRARAQRVFGALGGASGDQVADAVGDLARDCVTLPEWVERDLAAEAEAGDFCWTFGPAVAEAIAASLAAVAGLTDQELLATATDRATETITLAKAVEVVEDLSRDLDCLSPYLFGGLCRGSDMLARCDVADEVERRLPNALAAICAWSLVAVGRLLGYDRLTPTTLWEWGSGDALWVLVLAKGALALERPIESPREALLLVPEDLAELQDAVVGAVLGLHLPDVAFAQALSDGDAARDEVTMGSRLAELAQHRADLAAELVGSRLVGPLLQALAEASAGRRSQLPAFLAAVLQPGLLEEEPPWAGAHLAAQQALAASRGASADLRSYLGFYAEDLWALLAQAAAEGQTGADFLQGCGDVAYCTAVPEAEGSRLLQNCVAWCMRHEIKDAGVLTGLCVLASNLAARPGSPFDGGLAAVLCALPPHLQEATARGCARHRGTVRRELLAEWLALFAPAEAPGDEAAPEAPGDEAAPEAAPEDPRPALAAPPAEVPGGSLRGVLCGAPEHLRCSLDGRLLMDPVRSPNGEVYERAVLAEELGRNGGLCPVTRQPLGLADCRRDAALRQQAVKWVREKRSARPARAKGAARPRQNAARGEPNYDRLF